MKIIPHDNERTTVTCFSDPDEGQTMILDITELEATDGQGKPVGTMKLDENVESWSFIPNQDFNGKITLNYNVTDGTNQTSATNTFTLSPKMINLN